LTLVVHGAYSALDHWWRPAGAGAPPTFADRLEASLAARGMAGTVWTPALAAGFDTASFSWSGANSHSARKAGAKKLVTALQALATRTGASREDPLEVFIVGHSHGGNVALEMLRKLPDSGPCVRGGWCSWPHR
jgi:pimeloyl-ACP methyl ester carboxylesterase